MSLGIHTCMQVSLVPRLTPWQTKAGVSLVHLNHVTQAKVERTVGRTAILDVGGRFTWKSTTHALAHNCKRITVQ